MPLSSLEKSNLLTLVGSLSTSINALIPDSGPVVNPTISGLTVTPPNLPVGGGSVVVKATAIANAVSVTFDGVTVTAAALLAGLPFSLTVSHTFNAVVTGAAGTTPATASVACGVATAQQGALTWSRLDVGATGVYSAYFRRPVVNRANGDVWAAWGRNDPVNADGLNFGSQWFRQSTKRFALTSTTPGPTKDIDHRENYGACYDGDGNRIWIGNGGPVGYGFPPAAPPFPQFGDMTMDIASGDYALQFPVVAGTSMAPPDGAFLYYQGALYGFGGWDQSPIHKRILPNGAAIDVSGGVVPPCGRQTSYGAEQQEGARLTYARAGIHNGYIWMLGEDNELYTYDLAAGGPFVHVVTTGAKPPILTIVATVHEANNMLVAYCGLNSQVQMPSAVLVQTTWYLDLTSKVWTLGPNAAAGDAVPLAQPQCNTNLLYNPVKPEVLCVVDSSSLARVYSLRGSG